MLELKMSESKEKTS